MKAQAAMEYLMTYGWALLIVVIVGVALWSLGVFNVNSGNVVRMTGVTSLQLVDAKAIGNNKVQIVVSPKRPMNSVTLGIGANTSCVSGANWVQGQKYTVTCAGVTVSNAMNVSLTYTNPLSTLQHTETGTLSGL